MTYPQITYHAVLRYLERGLGVDIDGLRCRMATRLPEAQSVVEQFGEGAIIRDGLCFHLRRRDDGSAVLVSVTSAQASQLSNRALRLRRRRKRACQT